MKTIEYYMNLPYRLELVPDTAGGFVALPSGGLAKGALCVHHLLRGMTGIAADIIGQQLLVRFSRIRDIVDCLSQTAVAVKDFCDCHYRFATS